MAVAIIWKETYMNIFAINYARSEYSSHKREECYYFFELHCCIYKMRIHLNQTIYLKKKDIIPSIRTFNLILLLILFGDFRITYRQVNFVCRNIVSMLS